MLLYSSLVRTGFVFLTWTMQPNAQRKDTLGMRPYQASNGVLPFRALVGERLRMNTAVVTTSPQNLAGIPLAFIMDRAMSTTIWFCRSTTPFYCGEYSAVWCRTTPCSAQYAVNSTEVNSLPRSVLSMRSFLPLSASVLILNFLIAVAASSLVVRSCSHM